MKDNQYDSSVQKNLNMHADSTTEGKKTDNRTEVLSYLQDLTHTLAGILLVFLLLFRIVVVSGPSMKQTLLHGDYVVLINSVFYQEKKPGDIVVISKQSYHNGEPIIKRIIAMEGQEVDIDFAAGIVYVDGIALDEPYINTPTNMFEGVNFPLTVDKGCVFVMGDNRNDSKDSRSLEIGLVDRREIVGKAVFLAIPGLDSDTQKRDFKRIGVLS